MDRPTPPFNQQEKAQIRKQTRELFSLANGLHLPAEEAIQRARQLSFWASQLRELSRINDRPAQHSMLTSGKYSYSVFQASLRNREQS